MSVDADEMLLCQYDALDSNEMHSVLGNKDFYIYFIFKAPRLTIRSKDIKISGTKVHLKIGIHSDGEKEYIEDELQLNRQNENIIIRTKYPYNTIEIEYEDSTIQKLKVGVLMRRIYEIVLQNPGHALISKYSFLDLEVLYVGQSQGRKEKSTAPKRLISHSTYQKILAENQQNDPDSEIWIGLYAFDASVVAIQATDLPKKDMKTEVKSFLGFQRFDDHKDQLINIIEAAFIKFFEPRYNQDFKDVFPSETHKSYKYYYEFGLHSITIGFMPAESIGCRVFSKKTKKIDKCFITFQILGENGTIGPITMPNNSALIQVKI